MKLFILLLCSVPFISNSQTCIVLLMQRDTILIAADSRSLDIKRNPKTNKLDTTEKSICKIHNLDNIHFAIAGYPDGKIAAIIKEKYNTNKDVSSLYNSSKTAIRIFLQEHLESIRLKDNEYFASTFIKNDICSILFFGFNQNGPYASTLYFDVATDKYHKVKIKDTTVNRSFEILGLRDHLDKITAKDSIKLPRTAIEYIKWCIEYERKFHALEIGLPIDIMYVTRKGVKWVNKKQQCD